MTQHTLSTDNTIHLPEAFLQNEHTSQPLSLSAKRQLFHVAISSQYKEGECIWKMGTPADFFMIINSGFIEVSRFTNSDEETTIGIFGPGDALGMSAFLNQKNYPATTRSLSDKLQVFKFYARPILVSTNPSASEIRAWIGEMLVRHEQILRDKIDILHAGNVECRVVELLNHLIRRFGIFQNQSLQVRLPLNLTRTLVSKLTGSRVETIIRLISSWQQEDLVCWGKSEVFIRDWPRLRSKLTECCKNS